LIGKGTGAKRREEKRREVRRIPQTAYLSAGGSTEKNADKAQSKSYLYYFFPP
jgi:hypothetical protein